VPGPGRRRIRRLGRLPQGQGRPVVRGHRHGAVVQVQALRARRQQAGLHPGVRVLVPRHRLARAQGQGARPVRGHAGLQPAGHLLADRPRAARGGPHQVRLRPSRPVPGAVPVPVRGRPAAAVPRPAGARAPDPPDRGPRDLDQRLLPRHRHPPKRQEAAGRDGRQDRARPGQAQARAGRPGPRTSWCTRWAARTSRSR
jgi:hypothetical protein